MSQQFEAMLDRECAAAEVATTPDAKPYKTFTDLGPLKPESDDQNVLFKGNWLGRGGGLLITASSGVGKSSLTIQALLNWAIGREFIAKPNLPYLTCALIQSEDSVRDMQEIRDGMIAGCKANGWTEDEIDLALSRVHIWDCIGKTGMQFCSWLLEKQRQDPVDAIAINPIQGYFGGDVSKQEDVSRFLREGLDPIVKGAYGNKPCAVILVQHTSKITSGQSEGRVNVNDYGEYIGAGSHEWTDWCRAKLVFLKRKASDVYFDLKAAKRGKRLKWKDKNGEPTTNRLIAHSDGYIYWRMVDDPAEVARVDATDGDTTSKTVRPDRPPTRLQVKRDSDRGREANRAAVAEYVNANLKLGIAVNNETVRVWAQKTWTRDTARLAVSDFESVRESLGISKDEHDNYVQGPSSDNCQNEN